MKQTKRAMRSREEFWPELETWIIDQIKESRRVSTISIQLKANTKRHIKL
jgi:hypothetical protein